MKKLLKILFSIFVMTGILLCGCSNGNTNSNDLPPVVTIPDDNLNPPPNPPDEKPTLPPEDIEFVDFTPAINKIKNYLLDSFVFADEFIITTESSFAKIMFSIDILLTNPEEATLLWESDISAGFVSTLDYDETQITITIKKSE